MTPISNHPKPPLASNTKSRLRRRLRRIFSLLANLRGVAAYSGGYLAAAGVAAEMMRARGLGAVAGWAATATVHGRHLRPAGYRRFLRSSQTPLAGAALPLAVASTLGLRGEALREYVSALRAQAARHRMAIVLVTDEANATTDDALRVVTVPTLSVTAVVQAARHSAAPGDLVLLLRPGCLPAVFDSPGGDDTLWYGDEDRIDALGRRSQPFFKPGFSPDLLCASDYFGSLLVPQAQLSAVADEPGPDLHSLALRLVERAGRVARLPAVVAHRLHVVAEPAPPGYLATFLRNRYGEGARSATVAGGRPPWRCVFGNSGARVSVIVPTRDRLALLRRCVEGVFATNDGDFEVLVLDNDSRHPETLAWLQEAQAKWRNLRVLPAQGEFNWSRINNLGIAHASGDVFVFLNNDTEPRSENWLARLADVASRPDVGAVGPLLTYASGRIQHAGVVVGTDAATDHIYRGAWPGTDRNVFVSPLLPRNVAAITGACMAFSRRTLEAIGGFNEHYRVAGNDVEICVRAMANGLVNVYLPDVVLLHLESRTRGRRDPTADVARLRTFLATHCPEDPYHHPALSTTS